MNVCVLGLGYVGLPTAALLATKGFAVLGVDIDARLVETINRGAFDSHEPDLDILVKSAVQSGHLVASAEPGPADLFIIAVPTPIKDGHLPDVSRIEEAARAIAPHLTPGNLVVLESTSPVGTTDRVAEMLAELRTDLRVASKEREAGRPASDAEQISVAHCPERVLPGQILKELVENDRVVGGVDSLSSERARAFYERFAHGHILATDARTAELTKLAENAFRDVNIAYANELSMICDRLGLDVWEVIKLANHHPRVDILKPGPGVGGHCVAVDPWFLAASAPDDARLIRAAREVNDSKPAHVAARIKEAARRLDAPVIACLGLSFKADVDDLRHSPALDIVRELAAHPGTEILVVEPHIELLPAELANRENVRLVDLKDALEWANMIVLLVDHRVFRTIDCARLDGKVIVDTRGLWR